VTAHTARDHRRATKRARFVDELAAAGYIDDATVILLEDTLHALRDQWTASAVELDNGQAVSVLALLEAVFLKTRRPETLQRLRRAQWIYLDSWYRTHQLLNRPRKAVIADLCKVWKLGDNAIKRAIRDGRENGERVRKIWSHLRSPAVRIPQLEALIRTEQQRNVGSIRGRIARGRRGKRGR